MSVLRPDRERMIALREAMRRTSTSSLLAFARYYLAPRFTLPWNAMHRAIADDVQSSPEQPLTLVVGAPDGYGKTSLLSFAYPVWLLACKRARFIVLAASTRAAAGELLREIDQQLRSNSTLRGHFPHLAGMGRSSGASGPRASPPRDLVWPGRARITTAGPDAGIAQLTHEGRRPDVIIIGEPDPRSEKGSIREDERTSHRLERWVHRAIVDRLPRASVIVHGALRNADGLIDRLLAPDASERWKRRFYQAITRYPDHFGNWFTWEAIRSGRIHHESATGPDAARAYLRELRGALHAGVQVLWPEHESLEELMDLRALHGWAWFDRHRQGSPPGGCRRTGSQAGLGLTVDGGEERWLVDDAGFRRRVDDSRPRDSRVSMTLQGFEPPGRPLPGLAVEGPAAF